MVSRLDAFISLIENNCFVKTEARSACWVGSETSAECRFLVSIPLDCDHRQCPWSEKGIGRRFDGVDCEIPWVDEYLIAQVYAFRNEPDEAFEWLDRGYARHNDGLIETKINPLLKNLRSDPRYTALLKKLNLPH